MAGLGLYYSPYANAVYSGIHPYSKISDATSTDKSYSQALYAVKGQHDFKAIDISTGQQQFMRTTQKTLISSSQKFYLKSREARYTDKKFPPQAGSSSNEPWGTTYYYGKRQANRSGIGLDIRHGGSQVTAVRRIAGVRRSCGMR